MNKTELIKEAATKGNISKAAVSEVLNALLDTMTESFKAGDPVNIVGFGKFNVALKEKHTARNPMTGEQVIVPAKKHVTFKPSSTLKEELKK